MGIDRKSLWIGHYVTLTPLFIRIIQIRYDVKVINIKWLEKESKTVLISI